MAAAGTAVVEAKVTTRGPILSVVAAQPPGTALAACRAQIVSIGSIVTRREPNGATSHAHVGVEETQNSPPVTVTGTWTSMPVMVSGSDVTTLEGATPALGAKAASVTSS